MLSTKSQCAGIEGIREAPKFVNIHNLEGGKYLCNLLNFYINAADLRPMQKEFGKWIDKW